MFQRRAHQVGVFLIQVVFCFSTLVSKAESPFFPGDPDDSFFPAIHGLGGVATVMTDGQIAVVSTPSEEATEANQIRFLNDSGGEASPHVTIDTLTQISALAPGAEGTLFIYGSYRTNNPQNLILKLRADRTLDPLFLVRVDSGFNPPRAMLELPDGRLIIAGGGGIIGGVSVNNIAAVLPNGKVDKTFLPKGCTGGGWGREGQIYSLRQLPDQRILLAGYFESVQGQRRNGVARLLPNGELDPDFIPALPALPSIRSMQSLPDGRVILAQQELTELSPVSRIRPLRLLSNGSVDPSFAAPWLQLNSNYPSTDIETDEAGRVIFLVAQDLSSIPTSLIDDLNRFLPDGSPDRAFGRMLRPAGIRLMKDSLDRIYLLQGIDGIGADRQSRRILRLLGGAATPCPPQILSVKTNLVVGEGQALRLSARFFGVPDPQIQWTWNGKPIPGATEENYSLVSALRGHAGTYGLIASNQLGVITQTLYKVSVLSKTHVASAADPSLVAPTFAGERILALAELEDSSLVLAYGKAVTNVGIVTLRHLEPDGRVRSIVSTRFTGTTQLLNAPFFIRALPDQRLLVSGDFTNAQQTAIRNIARLNADGSLDSSYPGLEEGTTSLRRVRLLEGGRVLLLADRIQQGEVRNGLAILDANGYLVRSFVPPSFDYPHGLIDATPWREGRILVWGRNVAVEGQDGPKILAIHEDGSVDPNFNAPGALGEGVAVAPDHSIFYGFTNPGDFRLGVKRLLPDGSVDPSFATDAAAWYADWQIDPRGWLIMVTPGSDNLGGNSFWSSIRFDLSGVRDQEFRIPATIQSPRWVGIVELTQLRRGSYAAVTVSGQLQCVFGESESRFPPTWDDPLPDVPGEPDDSLLLTASTRGNPVSYFWTFGDRTVVTSRPDVTVDNRDYAAVGTYSLVISNALGTTERQSASVVAQPPIPKLKRQTSAAEINTLAGQIQRLSALFEGAMGAEFQWYHRGQTMPGQTSTSLLLPGVSPTDAGVYELVARSGKRLIRGTRFVIRVEAPLPTSAFDRATWGGVLSEDSSVQLTPDQPPSELLEIPSSYDALHIPLRIMAFGPGTLRFKIRVDPSPTNFTTTLAKGSGEKLFTYPATATNWLDVSVPVLRDQQSFVFRFIQTRGLQRGKALIKDLVYNPDLKTLPYATSATASPLVIREGESTSLYVRSWSPTPVTYTWTHDDNLVVSATGPILEIPHATELDAGRYLVKTHNPAGQSQETIDVVVVPKLPPINLQLPTGSGNTLSLSLPAVYAEGRGLIPQTSTNLIEWVDVIGQVRIGNPESTIILPGVALPSASPSSPSQLYFRLVER